MFFCPAVEARLQGEIEFLGNYALRLRLRLRSARDVFMKSVLFLCTGNSCRSQMAEAIVNARHPEWKAYSAGTKPAGYIHELAIEALDEIGIPHAGESKHINDLPTRDFDLVVTVCDSAAEECPVWPGKAGRRIHHSFVDPAKAEGTPDERKQVFRQVRNEMLEIIPQILNA